MSHCARHDRLAKLLFLDEEADLLSLRQFHESCLGELTVRLWVGNSGVATGFSAEYTASLLATAESLCP